MHLMQGGFQHLTSTTSKVLSSHGLSEQSIKIVFFVHLVTPTLFIVCIIMNNITIPSIPLPT